MVEPVLSHPSLEKSEGWGTQNRGELKMKNERCATRRWPSEFYRLPWKLKAIPVATAGIYTMARSFTIKY